MEKERFYIRRETGIAIAHKLPWHNGKCRNLHGHFIRIAVTASREDGGLDENDIVYDLSYLGDALEEIEETLDHSYLNDVFENPTSENLAKYVRDAVVHHFEKLKANMVVTKVVIEESPGSKVILEC